MDERWQKMEEDYWAWRSLGVLATDEQSRQDWIDLRDILDQERLDYFASQGS